MSKKSDLKERNLGIINVSSILAAVTKIIGNKELKQTII